RDTGGLDLTGGDPPRLEGLDAEVAEHDARAALGVTLHPPSRLLAVLDLLRHQHRSVLTTAEVGRLVVLTRATLHLLLLGDETLELGVGLAHDGHVLLTLGLDGSGRLQRSAGLALLRPAVAAARGH